MYTKGFLLHQAIFLFEFKILCKAVKTTHNINNTFGQELLMNIQCSGGLRSFAKETRALKMRSVVAGHQKLTTTERIIKADSLKPTEVAKELNINSMVIWHLEQT